MLTVPKMLRLGLARDLSWASWIGGLAVRAIGAGQRRIARARGIRAPLTGAVTSVQRFGGLVTLNVHFHLVVRDGVFVEVGDGLRFVMRRVARRLASEAVGDIDEDAAPDVGSYAVHSPEVYSSGRRCQLGEPFEAVS